MKKGEFSIIIFLLILALLLSTASIIITSTNTGLTGSTIGEVNANITGLIAFTISPDSIDFGNIILGGSNDTIINGISPFILTNTGNAKLDITVTSGAPLLTGTSSTYAFNSSCSESDCAGTVYDSWTDFTQSSQNLVKAFEFDNAKDALRVDLKIGVPLDEPAGAKSDTLTFTASEASGGAYATGGTITEVGGYRIHTFTSNGTFEVFGGSLNAEVLIVAGGGGGGGMTAGGGGGGGVILITNLVSGTNIVTIGDAGVGASSYPVDSTDGGNSSFGTNVATGGGRGGGYYNWDGAGGGSGGGGGGSSADGIGGTGTTNQGFDGGNGERKEDTWLDGGGGGGQSSSGGDGAEINGFACGGDGGEGLTTNISGVSHVYGSGGGGGALGYNSVANSSCGIGGTGAGDGAASSHMTILRTSSSATYYGSGGGGGGWNDPGLDYGGDGYQGIVIVRYLI